jgi:hypothetical protein
MPSGFETTLVILAWTYFAGLAFWLLVRRLLGDRPLLLFLHVHRPAGRAGSADCPARRPRPR